MDPNIPNQNLTQRKALEIQYTQSVAIYKQDMEKLTLLKQQAGEGKVTQQMQQLHKSLQSRKVELQQLQKILQGGGGGGGQPQPMGGNPQAGGGALPPGGVVAGGGQMPMQGQPMPMNMPGGGGGGGGGQMPMQGGPVGMGGGMPGQMQGMQPNQQRPIAQPNRQLQQVPMPKASQPSSPGGSNFPTPMGANPQPVARRPAPSVLPPSTQSRDSSPQPPLSSFATPADSTSRQVLSKRKIQDLVSQIDPRERIDPEVEDALLEIADDFIESLTNFGCMLAKHRKSDTLEAKDIQLHLEKNWSMRIPGFGSDEIKPLKKVNVTEAHKQRLALLKKDSLKGTGQAKESKKH